MSAKNFNTQSARRNVAENDIDLPIRSSPRPSFHDRITADQIRSSFLTVGARARVSRYFIRVHSATQQFSSYNQNFHRDKSSETCSNHEGSESKLTTFAEILPITFGIIGSKWSDGIQTFVLYCKSIAADVKKLRRYCQISALRALFEEKISLKKKKDAINYCNLMPVFMQRRQIYLFARVGDNLSKHDILLTQI